jgi:hypothetical protein
VPVDVRMVFEDGSEIRERWDGGRKEGKTWRRWQIAGRSRIRFAEVDPDRQVALDVSRLDNGLSAAPDRAPRQRLVSRFVLLLSTLQAAWGL